MSREQLMQMRKLCEQQGIKAMAKQISAEARNASLEAQLRIYSQPNECDVKKKEADTPREPAWGRNKQILKSLARSTRSLVDS